MSDFHADVSTLTRLDPRKRVKYSLGLVLGVDEFEQEQAYFLERGRLHTRMLHGYGVIQGLRVGASQEDPFKIIVQGGLAVDRLGRELRVSPAQAANLGDWLAQNPDVLKAQELFVVLSYCEGDTDSVPIPGAVCGTMEENVVPSRVTESFGLRFSATAPDALEFRGLQRLRRLLGQLTLDATIDLKKSISPREIAEIVRKLAAQPEVPVEADERDWLVHPHRATEVWNAAIRTWNEEVRPQLFKLQRALPEGDADAGITLARITFKVKGGIAQDVAVDSDVRPHLMSSFVLQEHLGQLPTAIWDHGRLDGLERDEHPVYLRHDGGRELTGDLRAAGKFQVAGLRAAATNGEAVVYEQAIRIDTAAQGDLSGNFPTLTVTGLQGNKVAEGQKPEQEDVLTWVDGAWEPRPSRGGPVTQFVQVSRVPNTLGKEGVVGFELWFEPGDDVLGREREPLILEGTPEVRLFGEIQMAKPEVVKPVEPSIQPVIKPAPTERTRLDSTVKPMPQPLNPTPITPRPAPVPGPAPMAVSVRQQVDVVGVEPIAPNRFLVLVEAVAADMPCLEFVVQLKSVKLRAGAEAYELTEYLRRSRIQLTGDDGRGHVWVMYRASREFVVASGLVTPNGAMGASGNLEAKYAGEGIFDLRFDSFRPEGHYLLRATPIVRQGQTAYPVTLIHQDPAESKGLRIQVALSDEEIPAGGVALEIVELARFR